MKTIYFTRHGLTVMNEQGLRCGATESPLNETGRTQAIEAGKNATSLGIELIIASSMERAVETAQLIAREIGYDENNIKTTDLLRERDFGVLEGAPYVPDQDIDNIEGMEPEHFFEARIKAAVELINAMPQQTILIVGHGAVGRMLRHVLDQSIPFAGASHFANASITKLEQKTSQQM